MVKTKKLTLYLTYVSLQVSRRLGNMMYMLNIPLPGTPLQGTSEKPGDRSPEIGSPINCNSEDMAASPRDPEVIKSTEHIHEAENSSPPSASSEMAWPPLTLRTILNQTRFWPDELFLPRKRTCLHYESWVNNCISYLICSYMYIVKIFLFWILMWYIFYHSLLLTLQFKVFSCKF